MKAVIQRVSRAEVRVSGHVTGKIEKGLLVLLAVAKGDEEKDLEWLIDKITTLRIFPNEEGKFDRSLIDIQGSILWVSQFTLLGDCRKGRRPGFDQSAPPDQARILYEKAIEITTTKKITTQSGQFGAIMEVDFINDGPVTFIVDSQHG